MKVFNAVPANGNRGSGRPSVRLRVQVEKDLAALDISDWCQIVKRRNDCGAVNTAITAYVVPTPIKKKKTI